MDEIKRLTPAQRARCNRLIRRLCANYDGGNCLPLDDGEGCVCKIDETQNVLATSMVKVTLKVRPYGYARYVDVNLGFQVTTNG